MRSDAAARWGLAAATLTLLGAGLWYYPQSWRDSTFWGFAPYLAVAGLGLGIGLLAGEIRRSHAFAPPPDFQPRPFPWRDAFCLAAFATIILVGVEALWDRTATLTAVLAAGSLGMLLLWKSRVDVAAYLFAAALGPAMEWVCIRKWGFWQYSSEMGGVSEFGIPVWLPLVWGYLFVLFRRLSTLGAGLMRFTVLRAAVLLLFGGYFLVSMQLVMPAIGTAYAIVLVLTVTLWRDEADLLMFLVSGTLGTLGEFISVQQHLWNYGEMAVIKDLGMPISLPFAWGFSGVLIRRFAGMWETRTPQPVLTINGIPCVPLENVPSAVLYVNQLLLELCANRQWAEVTFSQSTGLPRFHLTNIPDFDAEDVRHLDGLLQDLYADGTLEHQHVVNRLKAMCALNPVAYPEPKTGIIKVAVRGVPYDVEARFDDRASDPSVTLRVLPTAGTDAKALECVAEATHDAPKGPNTTASGEAVGATPLCEASPEAATDALSRIGHADAIALCDAPLSVKWTNLWVMDVIKGKGSPILSRSLGLPILSNVEVRRSLEAELSGARESAARSGEEFLLYPAIVNRLKIMCNIDPVVLREPTCGIIRLAVGGVPYDIEVRFDDRAADPSVTLRVLPVADADGSPTRRGSSAPDGHRGS